MAPVFVPMFMLLGYPPEVTQAAYRVGDSVTNVISPMMSYFALIIAFVQRYVARAGLGTLVSLMLPYSVTFLIGWSLPVHRVDAARLAGGPRRTEFPRSARRDELTIGPVSGSAPVGAVARRVALQGGSHPHGARLHAWDAASLRSVSHSAATCSRSVRSAPIDTRTIQRPSRTAGVT